jgi:hypothetical protein
MHVALKDKDSSNSMKFKTDLESKRRWDFELFKHINKLKIYRFTAIDEINVREYRKDNPEKLAT